jgi:hypothetical protein
MPRSPGEDRPNLAGSKRGMGGRSSTAQKCTCARVGMRSSSTNRRMRTRSYPSRPTHPIASPTKCTSGVKLPTAEGRGAESVGVTMRLGESGKGTTVAILITASIVVVGPDHPAIRRVQLGEAREPQVEDMELAGVGDIWPGRAGAAPTRHSGQPKKYVLEPVDRWSGSGPPHVLARVGCVALAPGPSASASASAGVGAGHRTLQVKQQTFASD